MARTAPTRWLRDKAAEGLTELPANAAWLLSKAFSDDDSNGRSSGNSEAGPSTLRTGLQKAKVAAANTLPFVSDSLETRIRQARDAVAQARQAEEAALAAAHDAKEVAARASSAADEGARRLAEGKADRDALVEQRVAQAKAKADEMVARERAKAEREGDERLDRLVGEVDAANERAQRDADEARTRAQKQVDDAARQMADARRLADEAAHAAQEAADAAHEEAQRLAAEAGQHSDDADADVASTEEIKREVRRETARTVRGIRASDQVADLSEQTKAELLELATGLGVEGRSHMRKDQLVKAVKKATAAAR